MSFSFFKILTIGFLLSFVGLIVVSAASLDYPVDLTVLKQVGLKVQWAIPEGRVGPLNTNWDTIYYLYVKDPATSNLVYKMNSLATTTVTGENTTTPAIFALADDGNYDVFVKTHQHLSRKLGNIFLTEGPNILNFTTIDNSVGSLGSVRLLAGDINGAGITPETLGDNEINSVDLSIMLNDLDADDSTTRGIRANLNQDIVVNSVDLSLLLKNLDVQGE